MRGQASAAWWSTERSELDSVAHRIDAGLGAGFVRLAARRARDTDAPNERACRLDHHAAAEDDHARKRAQSGLRHAGLADADKVAGVGASCDRGPGLARSSRTRVRAGEAVAQHDLRDAEPVDHRDGDLEAARAAACK